MENDWIKNLVVACGTGRERPVREGLVSGKKGVTYIIITTYNAIY